MASLIQQFLDPFSPQLIWTIANISVVRAVWCWIKPTTQYEEFGLPLEQPQSATSPTSNQAPSTEQQQDHQQGFISPLIYIKGIRDFCYGVILLALRDSSDPKPLTILIGVGALMSLGDAFVVWRFGAARAKTAYRHAVIAVLFAVMYWLRLPDGNGTRLGRRFRVTVH
ncbi:hypothetical protein BDV12DRAFT_177297 [Aspergillus spectabilis]